MAANVLERRYSIVHKHIFVFNAFSMWESSGTYRLRNVYYRFSALIASARTAIMVRPMRKTMRDLWFVVQNSQFSIHIIFSNGHMRRICTFASFNIRVNLLAGRFFLTKSKNANDHESRIVWLHHKEN